MRFSVDAILNSFALVFVGEIGDKTQLLALLLVARFRKPWVILSGVLIATILNHALASMVGVEFATVVNRFDPTVLRYILAALFFAFALWMLIPDKDEGLRTSGRYGVLLTTIVVFFIAEMGDKTQLATIALAARYADIFSVTIGSTLGMIASNAIAVFIGEKAVLHVPLVWVRRFAALLFALFAVSILAIQI